VQVLALHEGVIVARSAHWQTTCTILHAGEETFLVDSVIYPDELDALPGILAQAGWALSGLLVTHGDWDHLLAIDREPVLLGLPLEGVGDSALPVDERAVDVEGDPLDVLGECHAAGHCAISAGGPAVRSFGQEASGTPVQ
jgi:glyoxylase-like metal-dependent hydrolase (beta-lactamase superfamily II)